MIFAIYGVRIYGKSEDFLDEIVANAEACTSFDGAGEAGVEDVRDEIIVGNDLNWLYGTLLRRSLISGLCAVVGLNARKGCVDLLQEVRDLLLFGLKR